MSGNGLRRGKTIEEIYQKKTQLEHILLRPDTYVGSTEKQDAELWIFDARQRDMVYKKISFVPALYKIFDEILVNAADNLMRDPKGMNLIDVTIDRQQHSISVMNNGRGIPVQIHKEHGCYVPELIFGHLLTSDNYDDQEKKVTGGRNGFGAKLANVFSKRFIVETADRKAKKKFKQVFEDNMSNKYDPILEDFTGEDFTRVTFFPDLRKFGMKSLEEDIAGLMMKRVYDIAGSTNSRCRVILNGQALPVTSFIDYVGLFLKKDQDAPCVHERVNDRWEIAMSVTDGTFQQVSFVNSINTIKGGTHVTHVADQLIEVILKAVRSKNKGGIDVKPNMVRNHLWVFINCLVENPAFDSQTKETLTTKASKFGSTCDIPEKVMKQVLKSGVVELVLEWVKAKEKVDVARQLKAGKSNATRILGIPKLEDANLAGTRQSEECTLILTEGDSAKALAVAGLSVIGRDRYGVFPLKGKVLNVRDANFKQVTGNAEIQSLLKILGIDIKRKYDNAKDLRYGSVMLMTDQDHDGSHIKGLLINLVHHWWPSLLESGFLKEFVTPIVKAWKDGKKDGERRDERSFFTSNEFEAWKLQTQGKGWKTKYYKGLGTSTAKEAKEYFKDMRRHEIDFIWASRADGEAIDLAFNKKRADDRKEWINANKDCTDVDHSKKTLSYVDFINKELVQFARYDVMRSIPSVIDGFKPSQRKVMFCAFKKKLRSDIKVAQFVGYVSEQSAYHHGEMSLENTIVNLAQTFVGSNNLNLLVPSGQFGTRLQGGKDHAAARYIYTRLNSVTRLIFHPDDDHVLEYLEDDGQRIEPKYYVPVIPMVLVNGADGIGVGWSTSIPNYDPKELVAILRGILRGQAPRDLVPWYRGFNGVIQRNDAEAEKFDILGAVTRTSDTALEVTELPVRTWTQSYKEFLEGQLPQGGRKSDDGQGSSIEDFREYHTENTVHFVLKLSKEQMKKAERPGLHKAFKLKSSMSTSNMMLFNSDGQIFKYNSALDIIEDFCDLRYQTYVKRKAYLVGKLQRETHLLSNKARFILMVVKGELELRQRKKVELLAELKRLGFKTLAELNSLSQSTFDKDDRREDDEEKQGDYGYLLGMALWSLTFEKVEELKKQLELRKAELEVLQKTSIEQMWDRDLEALSVGLDELEAAEAAEAAAPIGKRRKGMEPTVRPVAQKKRPVADLSQALQPCQQTLSLRAAALRGGREPRLEAPVPARLPASRIETTTAAGLPASAAMPSRALPSDSPKAKGPTISLDDSPPVSEPIRTLRLRMPQSRLNGSAGASAGTPQVHQSTSSSLPRPPEAVSSVGIAAIPNGGAGRSLDRCVPSVIGQGSAPKVPTFPSRAEASVPQSTDTVERRVTRSATGSIPPSRACVQLDDSDDEPLQPTKRRRRAVADSDSDSPG